MNEIDLMNNKVKNIRKNLILVLEDRKNQGFYKEIDNFLLKKLITNGYSHRDFDEISEMADNVIYADYENLIESIPAIQKIVEIYHMQKYGISSIFPDNALNNPNYGYWTNKNNGLESKLKAEIGDKKTTDTEFRRRLNETEVYFGSDQINYVFENNFNNKEKSFNTYKEIMKINSSELRDKTEIIVKYLGLKPFETIKNMGGENNLSNPYLVLKKLLSYSQNILEKNLQIINNVDNLTKVPASIFYKSGKALVDEIKKYK